MSAGTEVSYLDMPDEELLALDPSTVFQATPDPVEDTPAEPEVTSEEVPEPEAPEAEGEVLDPAPSSAAEEGEAPEANAEAAAEPESPPSPELEPAPEAIDYKAAYERLFSPFKANGRDIAVASVDDAISLMQMGANYNKKMAALKPNLKLMKLLETNGLLSEEKLGFLIDLNKKQPEAISKLIKDSGLDAYDLNEEKAGAYKPNTYTVDDREIELDTVLDEIQHSPAYTQTLSVVSNKWDSASKQIVANQPQLLKVINDHVERGIYDLIATEIERERMFGRLTGLSDIEAYRQVGDAIQARGGFNHLTAAKASAPVQVAPAAVVPSAPKPKALDEEKLREKRRAASSTKPAGASASSSAPEFNPLALSDEEFSKVINSKFL